MKIKAIVLFSLSSIIFSTFYGLSQECVLFPSFDENDLPGAVIGIPETYTSASLYGYINGGAELYREYGIAGAWINEVTLMGGTYTIEIYRMEDPEAAFGIYSVSKYQCRSLPVLYPYSCLSKYQLQLCSGPYYINIINTTGNHNDSIAELEIGAVLIRKIKESSADLGDYFPGVTREDLNKYAVLVKGDLGIMNSVPELDEFLGESTDYSALMLKKEDEQTMLSIKFNSKTSLDAFIIENRKIISTISENHVLIKLEK